MENQNSNPKTELSPMQPEAFFKYFYEISASPRNSGEEEKIADYLCAFAKAHGLFYDRDEHRNVLICKAATPGYEHCAPLLIQGHTDMVCETAPGRTHDFTTMPIDVYRDGDVLRARGTTLGADDGAAVAYMMMLLSDDTIEHPPLQCLFTAEEETGLCGATNFDYSKITAAAMINLDGEREGEATVGCAGGVRCYYDKKLKKTPLPPKFKETYRISVTGLCGGHSGADIHKNRLNANRVLAEILRTVSAEMPIRLCAFSGGSKDNAIPRSADAVIACQGKAQLISALMACELHFRGMLSPEDKNFKIELSEEKCSTACSKKETAEIIDFLLGHENGVIKMSEDIAGLVETSANAGIVKFGCDDNIFHVSVSMRSSIDAEKKWHQEINAALARKLGFSVVYGQEYPGWAYRKDSRIREIYKTAYRKTHGGAEPTISAIHAGLECGIVSCALPELDIIALGPTMDFVHTPDEYLEIPSVLRLHETIIEMLKSMK